MSRPITLAIDRLMARVVKTPGPLDTPCWVPTYKPNRQGYVVINDRQRQSGLSSAHRIAYEMAIGPIPEGLELDHLCRVTACCNPEHLEAVTHAENVRRGEAPRAIAHRTNTCLKGHSLDDAYRTKSGRTCRVCFLDSQRQRRLVALADDDPRHGTPNGYTNCGCRCEACRQARTHYMRNRGKRSHNTPSFNPPKETK